MSIVIDTPASADIASPRRSPVFPGPWYGLNIYEEGRWFWVEDYPLTDNYLEARQRRRQYALSLGCPLEEVRIEKIDYYLLPNCSFCEQPDLDPDDQVYFSWAELFSALDDNWGASVELALVWCPDCRHYSEHLEEGLYLQLCRDCGAHPGEAHHPDCDAAHCPGCGRLRRECGRCGPAANQPSLWRGASPEQVAACQQGVFRLQQDSLRWVPDLSRVTATFTWDAATQRYCPPAV